MRKSPLSCMVATSHVNFPPCSSLVHTVVDGLETAARGLGQAFGDVGMKMYPSLISLLMSK